MPSNKKLNLSELKILVFEKNQVTKQNKDRLFKLAKAERDIETIKKLRDDFGFKSARIFLDKLDESKLKEAIKNKDFMLIKILLKSGTSAKNLKLYEFIDECPIDYIDFLIKHNINLNSKDKYGQTALIIASNYGSFKLVQLLVNSGADILTKKHNGTDALLTACHAGHIDIVKFLIENGANIDVTSNYNTTPLWISTYQRNIDIVKFLIENGANINLANEEGMTPLSSISSSRIDVKNNVDLDIAKLLIKNKADINAKNKFGSTMLIIASRMGDVEIVKLLLDNGAKTDIQDMDLGMTALMSAVTEGHIEVVKILLQYNANVNLVSKNDKQSALTMAAAKSEEMVSMLISYGADTEYRQKSGHSAEDIIKIYGKSGLNFQNIKKTYQETIKNPIPKNTTQIIEVFFEKVNSKIISPFIAKQFVLEELEAASLSEYDKAQQFAKNSGFKKYEYQDAMRKSLKEVDGANGPQQILLFECLNNLTDDYDMFSIADIRIQIVEKIMKYHSLGRYSKKINRHILNNSDILDEYNSYILYKNDRYESVIDRKYFNQHKGKYIEIHGVTIVLSDLNYDNKKEKSFFEIVNTELLHEYDFILHPIHQTQKSNNNS